MRPVTLPHPVPTDLLMSRIGMDEADIAEILGVQHQQAEFLFAGLLADDLASAGTPIELVAVVDGHTELRQCSLDVPDVSETACPTMLITVAPVEPLHRLASSLARVGVSSSPVTPMPNRAVYALHAIYTGRVVCADPAIIDRVRSIPSHTLPLYMVKRSVQRLRRLAGVLRTTQAGRLYQVAYVKALAQAMLATRGYCNPHPSAAVPLVQRIMPWIDAPGDQLLSPDWTWSRPTALLCAMREFAAVDPVLRDHGGLREKDLPGETGTNGESLRATAYTDLRLERDGICQQY